MQPITCLPVRVQRSCTVCSDSLLCICCRGSASQNPAWHAKGYIEPLPALQVLQQVIAVCILSPAVFGCRWTTHTQSRVWGQWCPAASWLAWSAWAAT